MAPQATPPIDRVLSKIQLLANGCWLWLGTRHNHGYGVVRERYAWRLVHRVVYMALIGSIPEGLTLDHLCRNRLCVNPTHLEPVTNKENILRGEAFSAKFARRDCCAHGHPFTEENTYRYVYKGIDQGRICRTCHRERERRYRRRRVA